MKEYNIKPCPLCGGDADININHRENAVLIICKECKCCIVRKLASVENRIKNNRVVMAFINNGIDEAVEAWNRRIKND